LLRLGHKYGSSRLEEAARYATQNGLTTYKSVAAILKNGLDRGALSTSAPEKPPLIHENLRGADYYRPTRTGTTDRFSPTDGEGDHA
jgi:hypothetical protein